MNELLKIILSLSLSGALLILVLFLIKPFIKDKLSKKWQFYIWLIVVARLLLPFAPETNLMGTLFLYFDNAAIEAGAGPQWEPEFPEANVSNEVGAASGQAATDGGEQREPDGPAAPGIIHLAKQNFAALCLLIWLIVAACLLIRNVTVYQSFVKYIMAGRVEVSDMRLWERVGKLAEQTGVRGAVGLYTNSLISSPLLIGFFRPCIMLPTAELTQTDFENTILHELTHYKRRDMFYKWLVQVTICFHWFNPLVYPMGRELNRICELSCDEAVIQSLDAGRRRAYGDTLLNAMGAGGGYKESVASVTLAESAALLNERLEAIMKYSENRKPNVILSVLLAALIFTGGFALGAYSVKSHGEETTPGQTADVGDPVYLAAKRMQEGWDIFWCYYGMNYEGLQIDWQSEVLQADDGRTYQKVGRFSTMSALKSATEAVFTKSFCTSNLYPHITELNLFREIDGLLCYSTEAGGMGGAYDLPYTYTLKSQQPDRIILSAACLRLDGQACTFDLVLVKEDGAWKLDTFYGFTSTGYTGDLPELH